PEWRRRAKWQCRARSRGRAWWRQPGRRCRWQAGRRHQAQRRRQAGCGHPTKWPGRAQWRQPEWQRRPGLRQPQCHQPESRR
ncbi:hypothetical protein, partial [Amycolatopsis dongchuanensis]|uniref:hypothetical protein n=1 Tax=Amycolatopsis dongchuanensis TaxID=1070866 RepID=UPI0031F7380D